MKLFKISSLAWIIIFIVGSFYIWFRKEDASGVANVLANQLISLGMWIFIFVCIFAIYSVWHHFLVKR